MSEYTPFDLEENAATEEEKKLRAKLLAEQDIKDLQWVMGDKRGRRFMWRLLERSGVFRISYTGNSETYFREGMRNIGIMQLDDLKTYCEETYIAMERERKDVNKRNADDSGNKQH